MKNHMKVVGIGLVALAIAGLPLRLHAQESDAPATAQAAPKSERALPFNGTLKAVDKEAGTVLVGNRTFKLTPETRYLQGDLDAAKVGEKVGGSYQKASDGTLMVSSIRFGPKPKKGMRDAAAGE